MQANTDVSLSGDVDAIKQDLREMRADFVRLTEDLTGLGRDGAAELRRRAQERAALAQDRVHSQLATARERVRQQPLLAVLGALGAGVILGAVLRRK
jgi:hypothetical protein